MEKTLIGNNYFLPKELINLKKRARTEFVKKSLLATAFLVAGFFTILFFFSNFLAVGIAIALISSLAIYQYYTHYQNEKDFFELAANGMIKNL